jgi:RNA polymerase sigma factor (sigma-70 family)
MNLSAVLAAPLIESARAGIGADVDALIALAWPHAYRIALSVVRETALAEDVAQESCAILARSLPSLRRAESFNVWFYRIVMREALKVERRQPAAGLDEVPEAVADSEQSVVRLDVQRALSNLPPAQRAAMVLHYYADLNSREIAQVLGIPDSSVRFHIMLAKRTLELALSNHREPDAVRMGSSHVR